jgi:hypothetical protein
MSVAAASVLSTFAQQLRSHTPGSEAGVREVLAQSCREALRLNPSEVEVEAAWGAKRLDLRVSRPKMVFELKYQRAIPSGRNRPMTAQFGQLLGDVRKLATVDDGSEQVLVLVTDTAGRTHLLNKGLLPATIGARTIREPEVLALAQSAARPAVAAGRWIDVEVSLVSREARIGSEGLEMLAWTVSRIGSAQTAAPSDTGHSGGV